MELEREEPLPAPSGDHMEQQRQTLHEKVAAGCYQTILSYVVSKHDDEDRVVRM